MRPRLLAAHVWTLSCVRQPASSDFRKLYKRMVARVAVSFQTKRRYFNYSSSEEGNSWQPTSWLRIVVRHQNEPLTKPTKGLFYCFHTEISTLRQNLLSSLSYIIALSSVHWNTARQRYRLQGHTWAEIPWQRVTLPKNPVLCSERGVLQSSSVRLSEQWGGVERGELVPLLRRSLGVGTVTAAAPLPCVGK